MPAKSGKLQLDEAAQRTQEKPAKVEVIKKPTLIRKEIQPQDLSLRDLQRADWPKKDSADAVATQDQAKKQASQSSLTNSKPVSKSKRLSEKASKESAKPIKPSQRKASPPSHITAFLNLHEAQSSSASDGQPRPQALPAKKSQSSLTSSAPPQQL